MEDYECKPDKCKTCEHYETDCHRMPCADCEEINTLYDNYKQKEKP